MPSPTLVTTIAFPILFTINTYISYKSHAFIPQHGPFEPYVSVLSHLIVQLSTLQAAWGSSSPFLVRRLSSLGRIGPDTQELDNGTRKAVNKVLASYQTSCVFLFGIVLNPFIWISRAYSIQQLGIASISGKYVKIGLWAVVALTCGICFRLWTAVYEENRLRITQLVDSGYTVARNGTLEKASPSETQRNEVVLEKQGSAGEV